MEYFEVGKIVNTQGLKGEMRVISFSDDPKKFDKLATVIVVNDSCKEYEIQSVRYHKQFIIIKFLGIDNLDDAIKLKNSVLKVTKDKALVLEQDEYYIRDIYDMNVIDENGELLGIISDIMFTGANDVYVVKKADTKDLLIPAIKECILKVDVKNKQMQVKLLEGLKEI